MIKKTIKFKDLDDNEVADDFYFNITKAEGLKLHMGRKGGLSEYVEEIVKSEDNLEILAILDQILKTALGRRSEDGRRFIKTEEIWLDFFESDAYSELVVEFFTDPTSMALFVEGVLPKDMGEALEKALAAAEAIGSNEKKLEEYTDEELLAMSQSEFDKLVGTDARRMSREHLVIAHRRKTAA